MSDTYNGWSNRETWLVGLWLDNDVETYHMVRRLVARSSDDYQAAESLKALLEDNNPLTERASVHMDLLSNSLSRVDWYELVKAYQEA